MEIKMTPERFKKLLEELDGNSVKTLAEKNARYATNGDCLHNFRSGADIAGGTPAQACWGYATKHLVALRDMVEHNDFSNREDFLEKCQDTINYIRFLWCIGNECAEKEHEIYKKLDDRFTDTSDIVYSTWQEAERVYKGMYDFVVNYGRVTVAEMCIIANLTSKDGDLDFGWDMDSFPTPIKHYILKTRNGYVIDLPIPKLLEKI